MFENHKHKIIRAKYTLDSKYLPTTMLLFSIASSKYNRTEAPALLAATFRWAKDTLLNTRTHNTHLHNRSIFLGYTHDASMHTASDFL